MDCFVSCLFHVRYFIWTGKGYHIVQYAKGGGFFEAKPEGDNTMEGRFTRSDGNVLTITFDEVRKRL